MSLEIIVFLYSLHPPHKKYQNNSRAKFWGESNLSAA